MDWLLKELERELTTWRGVPAFGVKSHGELGRASAELQGLPSATDERRAVPGVYRGLECLASSDPGPLPRIRVRTVTWIGEGGRADQPQYGDWVQRTCQARSR